MFELSFFPFFSLPVDGEADVTDENKQGEPVRRRAWAGGELGLIDDDDDDDDDDDIYIMVKCLFVCMFVTKNHHFFLLVSCNHLNHP